MCTNSSQLTYGDQYKVADKALHAILCDPKEYLLSFCLTINDKTYLIVIALNSRIFSSDTLVLHRQLTPFLRTFIELSLNVP